MDYFVVITEGFTQTISGVKTVFKINTSYPLVEEGKDVYEDGIWNTYNTITYNEVSVDIPFDSSVVMTEEEMERIQGDATDGKTPEERFYEVYSDLTADYLTAYEERLGIVVNPFADVDRDQYQDHDESGYEEE